MSDRQQPNVIRYRYRFQFANGAAKDFEVALNAETLELVEPAASSRPAWTKLKYQQCERCPLGDEVEYCPVAVNLSSLVEAFGSDSAYEPTLVTVQAAERTYEADTTLQDGLRSMIGIYMVSSNCPVMDKLRPNVRFHLPFASPEETMYRAVAMYLTAQYFRMRRGQNPDWELRKLAEIYRAVGYVNRGISLRLRAASTDDASVNAVVTLSTFSETLKSLLEESLDGIEPLFGGYTRD